MLEEEESANVEAFKAKLAEALQKPDVRQEVSAVLGIEARSILKSIETETQKLLQFDSLSRTDRHYFRARFNYYKLSILRLRAEEREVLEPKLVTFHQDICQREFEGGGDPSDVKHAPFLDVVRKEMSHSRVPGLIDEAPKANHIEGGISYQLQEALVSELSIVKLALQAKPSADGQKIIADAIDRMISKLKS